MADDLHVDEFSFSIFALNVQNEWPRRLLHIPSMTSRVWQPGNTYGPDIEPTYAIISYTWGRFEVPTGPRIQVNGIDWTIPSINESHFAVADLHRVLQHIRIKEEYVWIDIACIDQKRLKPKMEEVGRQASIFKRARRSYIWLNRYDPTILQQYAQTLMQSAHDMANGDEKPLQDVEELDKSIQVLLKDFWFSSLWTLQESVLKRQALILDKDGNPLTTHGPWIGQSPYTRLLDVSGALTVVRLMIDHVLRAETCTPPHSERLQSLRTVIDESGLNFELCPNPNIQYAAARFRTTRHPEDRIYAIMQIYGYRLGNTAESDQKPRKFTIEDLELQFLKEMTSQSAVLSQAFQHLQPPLPGQSWSIINHIGVPKALHYFNAHEQFLASATKISVHSKSEAYFKGIGCSLADLCAFWKDRRQGFLAWVAMQTAAPESLKERYAYFKKDYQYHRFQEAKQAIILDYSQDYNAAEKSFEWPPNTSILTDDTDSIIECRDQALAQAADEQQRLADKIINKFGGDKIGILYLGRSSGPRGYMGFALVIVHVGFARKWITLRKNNCWKRIGFCYWHHVGRGAADDVEKLLFHFEGKFA